MKEALAIFLLTCGGLAKAQELPKNAGWDISAWFSGATGEESTNSFLEAQTWSAGVFFGRTISPNIGAGWRRGQLEYGFELIPFFAQSKPNHIYGGGFSPIVFRWNSALRLGVARPYIELGGGGLRTTTNFPKGDTSSFNFTAQGGGGVYIPVRRGQFMDLGVRWSHISNANLGTRNPEFNGIEVRFGYHWVLKR